MVYADSEENSRTGQRKRKHEDKKQDVKTTKTKLFDQGEGSGTTSEVEDFRGVVGPISPQNLWIQQFGTVKILA